jgi:hypothetical protein
LSGTEMSVRDFGFFEEIVEGLHKDSVVELSGVSSW